ncbi:MAG: site-2 protease family protein [Hyphomicrobiaceae bacterium]
MFSRAEIGRIFGIPIYLDMFFVLVLILLSYPYFTRGDTQYMSAGVVIIIGLLVSILLHELGHALMGRLFGAEVSHIELTGLGGVAHFARSLPASTWKRMLIFLAGPAVNLVLWLGLYEVAVALYSSSRPLLTEALLTIAVWNLYLMIFNLLPAFPLDGGHTLDAFLGLIVGPIWAQRVVGVLGLIIAVAIAVFSVQSTNLWMLLLAFILFMANSEALKSVGGWRGRG